MSRIHPLTILCALACTAGFLFSAVSTSDFVAHLDRQVHGIHCSFLPGLAQSDTSGETGCHVTLMSPYSSVLRESIWGGVPVALPGMAVFSFLGFWCLWIAINRRDRERRATGFLFAGSLVPLLTSALMGYLSVVELEATCKLCIGIYASSFMLSACSLILWRLAPESSLPPPEKLRNETGERPPPAAPLPAPLSLGTLSLAFVAGLTSVAISVGAYAAAAPDFSSYIGSCGSLPYAKQEAGVLIPFGPQKGNPQMVEVIDPLCPSCRGFEKRFSKMSIADDVDRQLLLFPLDESCNWMIDRSIHPGACSISEAVLCSSDPGPVLDWAFEHQKEIMAASQKDPKAAANMAKVRFPALSQCIGSAEAGAKVNQSLRWAVKNQLQILTPQVFIEGTRLCGEDTDLGLDFALPRLIAHTKNQPRPKEGLVAEEPKSERKAQAPSEGRRDVKPASDKERAEEKRANEEDPSDTPAATNPTTTDSATTERAASPETHGEQADKADPTGKVEPSSPPSPPAADTESLQ
jgi:uncharacterized membrane protein